MHRTRSPTRWGDVEARLEEETVLFFDKMTEATKRTLASFPWARSGAEDSRGHRLPWGGRHSLINAIEKDPLLPDFLTGNQVMALIGETRAGDAARALAGQKFPHQTNAAR